MPGPSRERSWWGRDRDLLTLLKRFTRSQATHDHDRIYALLGLCPEANARIPVNYGKPIRDLIRETLSFIFKCNIDCLKFVNYSTVQSLLDHMQGIHNVVLESILRHPETNTVEAFLKEHVQSLSLTQGLIECAIRNECLNKRSLEAIFNLQPSLSETENVAGGPLHARKRRPTRARRTTRKLINLKGQDKEIESPLLIASRVGNEKCVRLLLDRGAHPGRENDSRPRALKYASEHCHEAIVELLLSRGVNCHAQMSWVDNPLTRASSMGHENTVQLLLDGGVDPNQKTGHDTPLLLAAAGGHENVVWQLLNKGANIEVRDNSGETPLLIAAAGGHGGMVRLLLNKGADIEARNNRGETPLLVSSGLANETVFQFLLDRGADPNALSNRCDCCDGSAHSQHALLSSTPLIQAARFGRLAIMQSLLGRGVDCNQTNQYGSTALLFASKHGRRKAVQLLLDRGADPNIKNEFGETPLLRAPKPKQKSVIEMLIEHGARTTSTLDAESIGAIN
ncbi:heterokaryon incompatibility protein-domain-containing protein [Apiospora sp. TS-2023a]